MGRGRNGPLDQSLKKPKIMKNKVRSGVLDVIKPKNKQQYTPLSLSEDLLAAKMESNTLSVICTMKMTTMKSSRNLITRVGAEPLRDIF